MTWYSNGSVAVANGSRTVTGTGTDFVSNVLAGQAFIGPDGRTYEVEQIVSATQAILRNAYLGGSAGGQAYAFMPTQSLMKDLADQAASLIASFAAVRDGAGQGRFGDGTAAAPGITFTGDQDTGLYRVGANVLGIATGGVRRVEFSALTALFADASGSIAADIVGRGADNGGYLRWLDNGRSSGLALVGFDPSVGLVVLAQSGSARLAASDGAAVYLRIGSTDKLVLVGNQFSPISDNSVSLGSPSQRYSTIYAGTGAINTSDGREKDWRGGLSVAELAASKEIASKIGIYRWLSAIADKGDAARLHVGVIAQEVIAALEAHDLDPMRYGFVCHDGWEAVPATPGRPAIEAIPEVRDEDGKIIRQAQPPVPAIAGTAAQPAGDRFGIRPDELLLFIAAGFTQRLAALEASAAM